MTYEFQLVVDAADPHVLADWWAETLGWPVEPSDEPMIRELVASGQVTESDTKTHRGVLVWRIGAAIRHPEETDPEHGRRILFMAVPESKTSKNRLHMDVSVGEQREAVAEQLIARGATFSHRGSQGPFSWITLTDPEGNEFCVT